MKKFLRMFPILLILTFGTAFAPSSMETVQADANTRILPVIMYHSVLKSRSGDFIVHPTLLERDLDELAERGYTTVTARQLIDFCNGTGDLPQKPVLMTFDDGNLNNLTYALPIYRTRGAHAVVSVVGTFTERAEKEKDHNPNFSSLTWAEIRQISADGTFEIGNHTYDMHKLSPRFGTGRIKGESDEVYAGAVKADVVKMQTLLDRNAGIRADCFAFPYGKITDVARAAVEEAGFAVTLTCKEGVNRIKRCDPSSLLSLKRYNRTAKRLLDDLLK